jgi:hypothetical protein
MNINLAQAANNAMLGSLAKLLNSGSIELLADTGLVLATLPLPNPAATSRWRCRDPPRSCSA